MNFCIPSVSLTDQRDHLLNPSLCSLPSKGGLQIIMSITTNWKTSLPPTTSSLPKPPHKKVLLPIPTIPPNHHSHPFTKDLFHPLLPAHLFPLSCLTQIPKNNKKKAKEKEKDPLFLPQGSTYLGRYAGFSGPGLSTSFWIAKTVPGLDPSPLLERRGMEGGSDDSSSSAHVRCTCLERSTPVEVVEDIFTLRTCHLSSRSNQEWRERSTVAYHLCTKPVLSFSRISPLI